MRGHGGDWKASLLLLGGLAFLITYKGPQFSAHFALSVGQIIANLAPLAMPVGLVALAILLYRNYWSRW